MAFSGSALVSAVKENSQILMVSGIGFLISIIMLILIGIFGGLVADGTIDVPSATNTTIQAIVTAAGTALTLIVGVFSTIAGFVIVVVLLKAFGIKIGGSERM